MALRIKRPGELSRGGSWSSGHAERLWIDLNRPRDRVLAEMRTPVHGRSKRVLGTLSLFSACLLAGASGCVVVKGSNTSVSPDNAAAKESAKPEGKPANPGGMWMPQQLPKLEKLMQSMGYDGEVSVLADPTKFPLNAVVSLGGCTASFVSDQGLVVTNHHCAVGMLGHNSTAEKNLMKTGFLARDKSQELPAGPGRQIYVTTAQEDVTAQITQAGASGKTATDRVKAMKDKIEEINASCTDFAAGKRCYVADFFGGSRYFLIRQDVIRDVRVVYAPSDGIGRFGGEVDNWQWPRHTGDFTFLRAYVGPDGKSAEYSPNNVPYQPKAFLKVANQNLNEGDFVMVAGYPGRTSRLRTASEVDWATRKGLPLKRDELERQLAVFTGIAQSDPNLAIKVAGKIRGFNNALTNYRGKIEGLQKAGLSRKKYQEEAELRAFIAQDEQRFATYASVLDEIAAVQNSLEVIEKDLWMDRTLVRYISSYASAADLIWETAKKRDEGKLTPSKAKRAEYALANLIKTSDPQIEKTVIKAAAERAAAAPAEKAPVFLAEVAGKAKDSASIAKDVDRFVDRSRFKDGEYLKGLLASATVKQLERNKDPYFKMISKIRAQEESEVGKQAKELRAKLTLLRPKYVEVLRQFQGDKELASDANSTLRVTFGTIRGYQADAQSKPFTPFTTVDEMAQKHTGKEPFNAPASILAANARKDKGPYLDPELKTLPVNFLSDLDITGGNSGSSTLNSKGELVGLVFDMNYQGVSSDWVFRSDITRAIHVDMRYVLWVMDAVDQADHLLQEMKLPSHIAPAVARR